MRNRADFWPQGKTLVDAVLISLRRERTCLVVVAQGEEIYVLIEEILFVEDGQDRYCKVWKEETSDKNGDNGDD